MRIAWISLLLLLGAIPLPASAAPRLLTAGGEQDLWLGLSSSDDSTDRSVLRYRSLLTDGWTEAAVFPRLIDGISPYGDRLLVWAADGWWTTHWPGGSGMGPRVPNMGSLRAMSGDGRTAWAVGFTPAGDRFTLPPTTLPATRGSAPEPLVPAGTLFASRWDGGRWRAVAELGATSARAVHALADARTAVVVVVGNAPPMVTASLIDAETGAVTPIKLPELPGTVTVSGLVGSVEAPLLWVSHGGDDAGILVPLRRYVAGATPVRLPPPADLATATDRAIAEAAGYLRLLYTVGPSGQDVREQRYDRDGTPIGDPITLKPAAGRSDRSWLMALEVAVLLTLLLAILAAARGRPPQKKETHEAE